MIVLTTSDSIIAKLVGAITANQPTYVVSHIDSADDLPDISQGDLNGTSEVTIVAAPGSGYRIVDLGTIFNADTATATVIVQVANGANRRTIHYELLAVNGVGYFGRQGSSSGAIPTSYLDTDGALAANSDAKLATQKAVKTFGDAKVSDIAYDATTWNGVTTIAPSKNAVRDKIETLGIGDVTAAANITDEALAVGDGGVKGIKALTLGAANLKLFMNAAGTANEYANGMKIGTFTIDTATASGTQAVSGIGFKPSHVDFFVSVSNTSEFSIGYDDGTNYYVGYNRYAVGAGTWSRSATDGSIFLLQSSGVSYVGRITTLGADGFTITWTKGGAKTGTAYIYYRAFR